MITVEIRVGRQHLFGGGGIATAAAATIITSGLACFRQNDLTFVVFMAIVETTHRTSRQDALLRRIALYDEVTFYTGLTCE
uniref:Uncharacterized protein n=1 Tax=Romanomermis culicivorax TaxID=13658 RepID=A0A915KYK0_ROMCU